MKPTPIPANKPPRDLQTQTAERSMAEIQIPGYRTWVRPVWVGIGVAVLVLLLWWSDLFVQTRLRLTNVFFVSRETTDEIVIVAADRASLDTYGAVGGWSRDLHAELVQIASAGGARVIAFDLLFQHTTGEDAILAEAIMAARTATEARTRVVMSVVGAQRDPVLTDATPNYVALLTPTDTLAAAATALGHTNAFPDADGAVRWQPTRIRSGDESSLSFGIVIYLTYLRIPADAFDQVVVYDDDTLTLANSRRVPVDDTGRMLINYWGGSGENTFPTYSFLDVIEGRVDPAVFNDKIVLVGLMNHVTPDDTYQVPVGLQGGQMAGVEIHANIIESLLQGVMLYSQNPLSQLVFIILFALGSSLIYHLLRRCWYVMTGALLGLVFLWFLGTFLNFTLRHEVLDLFHPALALVLPAPMILVLHTRQEIERRQQAELLLGSIVTASSQRLSLESILPGIANDMQRILSCDSVEYLLWESRTRRFKSTVTAAAIDDGSEKLAIRALHAESRVQEDSRLAVPLTWQGVPLGVLIAHEPARLTRTTSELLDLFTWQTSSIIANAMQHQEIQDLSDLKTRMIRMASHDLKNPLTVIIGYVSLIKDEYEDNAALPQIHKRFLEMMDTAAESMLTIINDILDLERVRRGMSTMRDYDLLALITRVIEQNEGGFAQKHHTFTADLPDEFPIMVGDQVQIREGVGNLLSNAIKYTPDGGAIALRLRHEDAVARIEVQDTGLGIPQAAQDRLFQEFYRVRTAETADIEGTGLGLSLVKAVVEAHGGRVWVESAEGQGSTFFVELPILSEELAARIQGRTAKDNG
ncbi:MAG: CHASE2 domain-containing protein [Anaerolineae bacterium]|nr:CHASE2 domain-containing protein [Anaerolineae bacterium]